MHLYAVLFSSIFIIHSLKLTTRPWKIQCLVQMKFSFGGPASIDFQGLWLFVSGRVVVFFHHCIVSFRGVLKPMIKIIAPDLAKDTAIDSQLLTAQVVKNVGWRLLAIFSMDVAVPLNICHKHISTYCNIMVWRICIEKAVKWPDVCSRKPHGLIICTRAYCVILIRSKVKVLRTCYSAKLYKLSDKRHTRKPFVYVDLKVVKMPS